MNQAAIGGCAIEPVRETVAAKIIDMAEKNIARLIPLVANLENRLEGVCMPAPPSGQSEAAKRDELPPYFNELRSYFDSVSLVCARLESVLSRLEV